MFSRKRRCKATKEERNKITVQRCYKGECKFKVTTYTVGENTKVDINCSGNERKVNLCVNTKQKTKVWGKVTECNSEDVRHLNIKIIGILGCREICVAETIICPCEEYEITFNPVKNVFLYKVIATPHC